MDERKYRFSWELLGDLEAGRPNLGPTTRVEVYRLMAFAFRDIMEKKFGTQQADHIFYDAGNLAGKKFYEHLFDKDIEYNAFVKRLQELLRDMKIGILRIEKADLEGGSFLLTISEDLDCSGLPELDYEVCTYDEGFIAGILESYSTKQFKVEEVDCWCTGDRTCRFRAEIKANAN